MTTLTLRQKRDDRYRGGHLWVFRDDLQSQPDLPAASLVRVVSAEGFSYGSGFYHPTSKIAVRLLGADVESVTTEFFADRFSHALAVRQALLPGQHAFRLIHGESDLLSGLVVDIYDSVAVIQMLAAGMDAHQQNIVDALRLVFPSLQAIVEKNMARVRELEGLELRDGILYGTVPTPLDIDEYGVTIRLDLLGGQKTGYFLDQKTNRTIVASLAKGKRVLDCFCNVGGFALHAAKAGATAVVGVDSSASAIAAAQQNAQLNRLGNVSFEVANAFDFLRETAQQGARWDIIILDPPSFAKKRSSIDRAVAGYAELNRLALKALQPGGILVSASCTQLVPESMLLDILYREAARLKRRLRLLYRGTQAADHPVLLGMPETQYLKCLVFDVLD